MDTTTLSPTPCDKPAHTPGPWECFGPFSLPDSNGGREVWTVSAHNDTQLICEVYTQDNAALIVAVPDLLAALANVRAALNCHYDSAVIESQYGAMIDAAIARAKGAQ